MMLLSHSNSYPVAFAPLQDSTLTTDNLCLAMCSMIVEQQKL